jgi:hypothetical protein
MHIEMSHVAASVVELHHPMVFDTFTDLELRLLYQNLCGQKFTGYSRDILLSNVFKLCTELPNSNLNGLELTVQSGKIGEEDDGFYRYQFGSIYPAALEEPFNGQPLTAAPGYAPLHTPLQAVKTAPAPAPQAASTPANAPRPRSAAPATGEPPKTGSKTGRVWEIADKVWTDNGSPSNIKPLRGAIVSACEAEGINGSTASVQYSKWLKTKG